MKVRLFVAVLRGCMGLGATSLLAAPTTAPVPQTREQIRGLVQPYIDDGYAPALVAGVVDATGVRIEAFGVDDRGPTTRAVTRQSIFEIGSVTKVFTGLLLADAVQRGEVTLDEPIQKLLPADVRLAESHSRPIELIDLATHRSGLPRLPTNLIPADATKPYDDYTVEKLNAFLAAWQPMHAPGEQASYSNLGVGLLGHLLANQAGTTYADLVRTRIFQPLGIDADPICGDVLFAHDEAGQRSSNWLLPEPVAGAGCLRLSGDALMKFVAAQLRPPPGPLGEAIRSSHVKRAGYQGSTSIALNWMIRPDGVLWHNGETGGFTSYVGMDLQMGVGVFVMENIASPLAVDLGVTLLHRETGRPDPKFILPRRAIALKAEQLDRFVGDYRIGLLTMLTLRRDGSSLMARITGQPTLRLFPESPTRCFWPTVDAQVDFEFVGDRVVGLTIHQNGRDTHGQPATVPTGQ